MLFQFSSVAQSCPTLWYPMNRSTPGLPVHHQLPEFTQTHVHQASDAIQPSHPLSSPSPLAPNPSQHQSLFQWVNSSHEVAKGLEFKNTQDWSPLGWTGWISLQSKGLSRVFSNTTYICTPSLCLLLYTHTHTCFLPSVTKPAEGWCVNYTLGKRPCHLPFSADAIVCCILTAKPWTVTCEAFISMWKPSCTSFPGTYWGRRFQLWFLSFPTWQACPHSQML